MDKTAATAITRKTPSKPARMLDARGAIIPPALDYGCGRGADAEAFMMDGYDPTFAPDKPRMRYTTILCSYVLNVVDAEEQERILKRIRGLLREDGTAYITVRRDIPKGGKQGRVLHRYVRLNLPKVFENSAFCTYQMRKHDDTRRAR